MCPVNAVMIAGQIKGLLQEITRGRVQGASDFTRLDTRGYMNG